jgi:hypothetical protein
LRVRISLAFSGSPPPIGNGKSAKNFTIVHFSFHHLGGGDMFDTAWITDTNLAEAVPQEQFGAVTRAFEQMPVLTTTSQLAMVTSLLVSQAICLAAATATLLVQELPDYPFDYQGMGRNYLGIPSDPIGHTDLVLKALDKDGAAYTSEQETALRLGFLLGGYQLSCFSTPVPMLLAGLIALHELIPEAQLNKVDWAFSCIAASQASSTFSWDTGHRITLLANDGQRTWNLISHVDDIEVAVALCMVWGRILPDFWEALLSKIDPPSLPGSAASQLKMYITTQVAVMRGLYPDFENLARYIQEPKQLNISCYQVTNPVCNMLQRAKHA